MSESKIIDRTKDGEDLYTASQWQLMTRKFAKHRLAVWSGLTVFSTLPAPLCAISSRPTD